MKIIIPDTHIAIKSSCDIDNICSPLKKFGITHFVYERSFPDGAHINFCINPAWTKYYYNEHRFNDGVFEGNAKLYEKGNFLWSGIERSDLFDEARERFKIDNGITLVRPQNDFCEFFYFGSTPNNRAILNFYLANLDILERFALYFKDQAKTLIVKASKEKIRLCRQDKNIKSDLESLYKNIILPDEKKGNFIKATEIKKYRFIEGGFYKNISPRELQCALLLLKGKSAKLIAEEFALSKRTVEVHLNNLKTKLNCFNKAELVYKLLEIGLDNFL